MNVWTCPGVNNFKGEELKLHPTVKPVAPIADAIKDVTARGGIERDPSSGSGSTLMAAEKTGGRGRAPELDPANVDVATRRWKAGSGQDPVHIETGRTFAELLLQRAEPLPLAA